MIKDIQAVIFDLDGSLVDSMWIWRQIDIEYLARYGLELPEDLQSCIEGMSFKETAEYFDISAEACKKRISRLKHRLQKILNAEEE